MHKPQQQNLEQEHGILETGYQQLCNAEIVF